MQRLFHLLIIASQLVQNGLKRSNCLLESKSTAVGVIGISFFVNELHIIMIDG